MAGRLGRVEGVDNSAVLHLLLAAGDGLVTRQQLRESGLCQRWLHRRVAHGGLIRVLPSVLRSPDAVLDVRMRVRAGLLQAGPDAALTHTTALWNWGLMEAPSATVHVCLPRGKSGRSRWLQVHIQAGRDVVVHNGMPTVMPADAIAAAAADLSLNELRFPTMEAARVKLIAQGDLLSARHTHVLGLLHTLDEEVAAGAESGGEAIYWRLLRESDLPTPVLQRSVVTYQGVKRLDAYWEELFLGVEIDGRAVHAQPAAAEKDTRRQNAIHATGVLVIRYWVNSVITDQSYVLEDTAANMEARRALLSGRLPVV